MFARSLLLLCIPLLIAPALAGAQASPYHLPQYYAITEIRAGSRG